jgi:hypothetical protein
MPFKIKFRLARDKAYEILKDSEEPMRCSTILEQLQTHYTKRCPSNTNQLSNLLRLDDRFESVKIYQYDPETAQGGLYDFWRITDE